MEFKTILPAGLITFVMGPNPSIWAKADESLKDKVPSGINNLKQDTHDIIYPNPANELVTIIIPGKQYLELSVLILQGSSHSIKILNLIQT